MLQIYSFVSNTVQVNMQLKCKWKNTVTQLLIYKTILQFHNFFKEIAYLSSFSGNVSYSAQMFQDKLCTEFCDVAVHHHHQVYPSHAFLIHAGLNFQLILSHSSTIKSKRELNLVLARLEQMSLCMCTESSLSQRMC